MGLQLAIISNTFSPRSVLDRQLEHFDLIRFFSVRTYSSETVYRKPDRRIFQATLSKLGATAAEAVMVGDREREDIKGARRLGIRTIWKRGTTNSHLNIEKADAVIESIGELPRLIERWREQV